MEGIASDSVNTPSALVIPGTVFDTECDGSHEVMWQRQMAAHETVASLPVAHLLPSLAAVREQLQARPGHSNVAA